MIELMTGSDLAHARAELKLTQREMADHLGISWASLKRYEKAPELGLLVALAAECLLRRVAPSNARVNARVTPEERAERKYRQQRRLAELRAGDSLLAPLRPVNEVAARTVALRAARQRLVAIENRNHARIDQRVRIARIHGNLKAALARGDSQAYNDIVASEENATKEHLTFVWNYITAAGTAPVPDDSPLISLPDETP